jgi:hypothetical protein
MFQSRFALKDQRYLAFPGYHKKSAINEKTIENSEPA